MGSLVGTSVVGANLATISPSWTTVGTILAADTALLWWTYQSTMTPTPPTGFTLVQSNNTGAGAATSRLYMKVCIGGESGTFNLVNSGANRQSAVLRVYRGYDATNPIDQFNFLTSQPAAITHACPTVTTGVANAEVVVAICERATTGTTSWTAPTLYGNESDTNTLATGSGGSITGVADNGPASAGPSGTLVVPGVWTSGNSFSTANVGTWTVSLVPAATGATDPSSIGATASMSPVGVKNAATAAAIRATSASVRPVGAKTGLATSALRATASIAPSGAVARLGTSKVTGTSRLASTDTRSTSGTSSVRGTASETGTGSKTTSSASRTSGTGLVRPAGLKGGVSTSLTRGTASDTANGTATRAGANTVRATASGTTTGKKTVSGASATTGNASETGTGTRTTSGVSRVSGTSRLASTAAKSTASTSSIRSTGLVRPSGSKGTTNVTSTSGGSYFTIAIIRRASGLVVVKATASSTASESAVATDPSAVFATGSLNSTLVRHAFGSSSILAGAAALAQGRKTASSTGRIATTTLVQPVGSKAALNTSAIRTTGAVRPAGVRGGIGSARILGTASTRGSGTRAATGVARLSGTASLSGSGTRRTFSVSRITANGLLVASSINPDKILTPIYDLTLSRTGPESSTGIGQPRLLVVIETGVTLVAASDDTIYPPLVIENEDQVLLIRFIPTITITYDG